MASAAAVSTTHTNKPRLSFWQIWNMSFGFLGIQFGFALQNANVSRIFETLGGTEIALYWLAAPLTGLLVQPVIGYLSDRTWSPRWGRRRPYFTLGAILASIALLVMPNVTVLWAAVGMLWIMDSSINISMEPFRALVGDLLPSEQRTTGFAAPNLFHWRGRRRGVVAALDVHQLVWHCQYRPGRRDSALRALCVLHRRHCLPGSCALDGVQHQRVPAREPGRV
jgi:MFS family permease